MTAFGLVAVAAVVVGLALSSDAGSASQQQPGGILSLHGDLTDKSTGEVYFIDLVAQEREDEAGIGQVNFLLSMPAPDNIGMCSGYGPGPVPGRNPFTLDDSLVGPDGIDDLVVDGGIDVNGDGLITTDDDGFIKGGFICEDNDGKASVRVDGCKAEMEVHGWVHSDHPNAVYWGNMTVDITYERNEARMLADCLWSSTRRRSR